MGPWPFLPLGWWKEAIRCVPAEWSPTINEGKAQPSRTRVIRIAAVGEPWSNPGVDSGGTRRAAGTGPAAPRDAGLQNAHVQRFVSFSSRRDIELDTLAIIQ
jgi:hypothetical protein